MNEIFFTGGPEQSQTGNTPDWLFHSSVVVLQFHCHSLFIKSLFSLAEGFLKQLY